MRKKLRLDGYDYSKVGCYYVTICVKDKYEMLGRVVEDDVRNVVYVELNGIGLVVQNYLMHMHDCLECAVLNKYVIMPNHVHLLITLSDVVSADGLPQDAGLRATGRRAVLPRDAERPTVAWTASPTKAVIPRIVHGMKSVTTKKIGYSIWQRSYYDHIIRSKEEYWEKWHYIDTNPAKWREDYFYIKRDNYVIPL